MSCIDFIQTYVETVVFAFNSMHKVDVIPSGKYQIIKSIQKW